MNSRQSAPPKDSPQADLNKKFDLAPTDRYSRQILDRSIVLGQQFLLNNQGTEGNFNYAYDFVKKELSTDDSQVRQAGALWGLATLYNDNPSSELESAIVRGLNFFRQHARQTEDDRKYVVYPDAKKGRTGTTALVTLALIDFLRSGDNFEKYPHFTEDLKMYLRFLLSLRMNNGQFHSSYDHESGFGMGGPSPYFDGETLLALIKAAKYAGYGEQLKDIILESAETMYRINITEALIIDPDSNKTKGFYQWSSMAYYEIYTSGWDGVDKYAQRVIDLAYWMIDVHETLRRGKNTAYAYEGLTSAWELARHINHNQAMMKIGYVIDKGLKKLTSWQVGGPIENEFLKKNPTDDLRAVGGILNSKADPFLRIDVTQHQMHALILARRYIYKTADATPFTLAKSDTMKIWFDDIRDGFVLTEFEREKVFEYITKFLRQRTTKRHIVPTRLVQDTSPRIVFLSISNGHSAARVFMGQGKGMSKAIEAALAKASMIDFYPKWFKVDVVQKSKKHHLTNLNLPLAIEESLQGLAFDQNLALAFLPEELTSHSLIDSKHVLKPESIKKYLNRNRHDGIFPHELYSDIKFDMYTFSTDSFFSDGKKTDMLYRGHRQFAELSKI